MTTMKITALAPWFGGNRTLAARAGDELGDLAWCGVPFAGGMPELPCIRTRTGVANDLHRHIINLARVVRDAGLFSEMQQRVEPLLFHPEEYGDAQRRCLEREGGDFPTGGLWGGPVRPSMPDVQWAADFFTVCWMGRGGSSGQTWEFRQNISTRWTASGGGSAKRWRSAVESLPAWCRALAAWEFTCLDVFQFLDQLKDRETDGPYGLYVDAPWPEAGENYRHQFTDGQQAKLAQRLGELRHFRVVVRFGDHPLIRKLYPADQWTWIEQESRNQEGNTISDVLILNGPSYTEAKAS